MLHGWTPSTVKTHLRNLVEIGLAVGDGQGFKPAQELAHPRSSTQWTDPLLEPIREREDRQPGLPIDRHVADRGRDSTSGVKP